MLATYVVTDSADSLVPNPGELRWAIQQANADPGSTIEFRITVGGPVISLAAPLDPITAPVLIDGTTQPGYLDAPIVEIDGSGLVGAGFTFTTGSDQSTIKGLSVYNFAYNPNDDLSSPGSSIFNTGEFSPSGTGVFVDVSATNISILDCYLGTNVSGTATGNAVAGVLVRGVDATIDGNVISNNGTAETGGAGIILDTDAGTTIVGNLIGVDPAGTASLANGAHGIYAFRSIDLEIGGPPGGPLATNRNVISGNVVDGVRLVAVSGVDIVGNYVGLDAVTGGVAIPNGGAGIVVDGDRVTIGDGSSAGRNVISGNAGEGLRVLGGFDNLIQGNFIGSGADGTSQVGNGLDGIRVDGGSATAGAGLVIGGALATQGNVIGNNAGNGIRVTAEAADVLIQQNLVGVTASLRELGNGQNGISLEGATRATVTLRNKIAFNAAAGVRLAGATDSMVGAGAAMPSGEQGLDYGNAIYANGGHGVLLEASADGNVVAANVIGRTAADGAIVGNIGDGVAVEASYGNVIGGSRGEVSFGNVIAGNATGVSIARSDAIDFASGNRVLANTIQTNLGHGVVVEDSSYQTVGGTAAFDGNEITLNQAHGIEVREGSRGVRVAGNYVGTTASLAQGLGNGGLGIRVLQSSGTLVGGDSAAGEGNVVIGNASDGIVVTRLDDAGDIAGTASGNVVQGNFVRANAGSGLRITAASDNVVGSAAAGFGNSVLANALDGLQIETGADSNLVIGNVFGAVGGDGNSGVGVRITASNENIIGIADAGNVIAGNATGGVVIAEALATDLVNGNRVGFNTISANRGAGVTVVSSSYQTLRGNFVGTDASGTTGLGNVGYGIDVQLGEANVLAGNTVARNTLAGIHVTGGGTSFGNVIGGDVVADGNVVTANLKGGIIVEGTANATRIANTRVESNIGNGISIQGGATRTVIDAATTVVASAGDGVYVTGLATDTLIAGAFIGTDIDDVAGLGNQGVGIRLSAASGVTIGAETVVARNRLSGVRIERSGTEASSYADQNVVTGATIRDNTGHGLVVNGSRYQTIGGTLDGAGNRISGNQLDGVMLNGASAFLLVQGNAVADNGRNGVSVFNANDVTISEGNEVTGNGVDGISFYGTSTRGVVMDNYLGQTALGDAAGNVQDGVSILGSNGITVVENVIGSNERHGVLIDNSIAASASVSNALHGNVVEGNGRNGITVLRSRNQVIGGTGVEKPGNTVISNGADGIYIGSGSSGTQVSGNLVGTDVSGALVGNANDGIEVNGSTGVVVFANVTRYNTANGLRVSGVKGTTATPTRLRSNDVFGNGASGVLVQGSSGTQIGGAGYGNEIGGNAVAGVRVAAAATSTIIEANWIGTDENGEDLGNTGDGVQIIGAAGNVVRGGNTISFNGTGVRIRDITAASRAAGNRIEANRITSNDGAGVVVEGAVNHVVGGVGGGNTITLNGGNGVMVQPSSRIPSAGILVRGNLIGTDDSQAPLGNGGHGVEIVGGSSNTVDRNTITDNTGAGVSVSASSTNVIGATAVGQGNRIAFNGAGVRVSDFNGVVAAVTRGNSIVGNTITGSVGNGVTVSGARTVATSVGAGTLNGALVGLGNTIAGNGGFGVQVLAGAQQVSIQANSIYDNAFSAVDLAAGANAGRAVAAISRAQLTYPSRAAAQVSVTGTLSSAVIGQQYQVDVYASRPEDGVPGTAGSGELYGGRTFLGRVTVTASMANTRDGILTFSAQVPAVGVVLGDYVSVMATTLRPPTGTSSAFAAEARELTV